MAAGLTVEKTRFAEFQKALQAVAEKRIPSEALALELPSDGELDPADLNLENALRIETGGPWGAGFPEPRFHGRFRVLEAKRIGADGNTLRLGLMNKRTGETIPAIKFHQNDDPDPAVGDECAIYYALSVNRRKGQETLQIQIEQFLAEDQWPDAVLDQEVITEAAEIIGVTVAAAVAKALEQSKGAQRQLSCPVALTHQICY